MWAFRGKFWKHCVEALRTARTVCRMFFVLILWGCERDFPCVQNHVLKLLLVVIKTVCAYLEEGYEMWFVPAALPTTAVRQRDQMNRRISKLTTDNVYVSPFTGKRPKLFCWLCAEINLFVTEMGDYECKYGCCWQPNPTCTGIKWKNAENLLYTDRV